MTTPGTTNATVAGAIKNVIESAGLSIMVFRDVPPPRAPLPFCVVTEGVAWNILPSGDTDVEGELRVREQAQVDIYQALKSATGERVERIGLEDSICVLLHRTKLGSWLEYCLGVQILARSSHLADNLRRTIVTVQIDRVLAVPA